MRGNRFIPLLAASFATMTALSSAALADNRVALIIGNSDYKNVRKLSNAVNDARAVKATLKAIGFKVVYGEDLDKRNMERAVGIFAKEANNADVALVYYSGHGSTFGDVPYLVPVDARYDSLEEVKHELVPVEEMVGELRRAKGVRLAVLDACRDNEAEQQLKTKAATRGFGESRGLARIGDPDGLIVAYSTQFLNTALDGNPGGNSPFTSALVKNLPTPGLDIKAMLFKTAQDVVQATGGNQRPEVQVSLYQDYSLVPAAPVGVAAPLAARTPVPVATPQPPSTQAATPIVRPFSIAPTVPQAAVQASTPAVVPGAREEALYWQSLQVQPSEAGYRDYLDKVGRRVFPGTFATLAREQLALFAAEAQRRSQAAAVEQARLAAEQQETQRIAAMTTQQLLDALARMQPEQARLLVARLSLEQRQALEQALAGGAAEPQTVGDPVPEIEATEFAPPPAVRRQTPTRAVTPRVEPRRPQVREVFEEAPRFEPRRRRPRETNFDGPPPRFERFDNPGRFQGEGRPRRFDGGGRRFEGGGRGGFGGGRGDGFGGGRGFGGGGGRFQQVGGFGGGRF